MDANIEPLKAAKPSKGRKKLLLLGLAGVSVLLAVGACLWLSGVMSAKSHNKSNALNVPSQPIFVETPEMVTNLDAGPHRLSFVKVQCKIEVTKPSDAAAVTAGMPRITDMIQTYLRETRPEELRTDAGTYRLREAILLRSSLAAADAQIENVLFEELIVQ